MTATTPNASAFDPTQHFTDLKGNAYLGARWRLVWLRSVHPDWEVSAEFIELDFAAGYAIVRAVIRDETGRLIATGVKSETRRGFANFVEKAETGAIGRACAVAGFGTEVAADMDEGDEVGNLSDAPVALRPKAAPNAGSPQRPVEPRHAAPMPAAGRTTWKEGDVHQDGHKPLKTNARGLFCPTKLEDGAWCDFHPEPAPRQHPLPVGDEPPPLSDDELALLADIPF